MKPISLKIDTTNSLCGCCAPVGPSSAYFPTVNLEFPSSLAPELPEEGLITFRFKVKRETENYEDSKCDYCLELRSIESVKEQASPEEPEDKDSEDILDDLRREVEGAD